MTTPETYPANATPVIRIRLVNGPRDVVVYFKGWKLMPDGAVRALTTPDVNAAFWYGDAPHECRADIKRLTHITGAMVLWAHVEEELERDMPAQCPECGRKLDSVEEFRGHTSCDECRADATHYLLQNNTYDIVEVA